MLKAPFASPSSCPRRPAAREGCLQSAPARNTPGGSTAPALQRSKASPGYSWVTLPWEQWEQGMCWPPQPPQSRLPQLPPSLSCGSKAKHHHQVPGKEQNNEQVLFSGPWSRNQGQGRRCPWSWSVVGARGMIPLGSQPQPSPPPTGTATARQRWVQTHDPPCAQHRQEERERNRRCSCAHFSL